MAPPFFVVPGFKTFRRRVDFGDSPVAGTNDFGIGVNRGVAVQ